MSESNPEPALICAYILDGKGGGREIEMQQIGDWKPEDGFLWVHLDRNVDEAVRWIESNVPEPEVAETLIADDTRPRAVAYEDCLLLTLRGVNLNPNSNPEDMVSLRAWIGPERAVTTRHRRIMAVNDARERIARGNGPRGPGDLLSFLSDRLVDRMVPTLTDLNDLMDDLESLILDGDSDNTALFTTKSKFRLDLGRVRRQAIALRRYLAPQREALTRLQLEEFSWLSSRHRVLLREASDHVTRYLEDLDSIRDRGAVIQDELRNSLSEDMNRTMYVLTVVAAILLPLSFITGLLGINVDGMPGSKDTPLAFWWVVGALGAFGILQMFLFRRLKWI
ncbi:MAG: zinc transporter ZntB [Alphaproteobacteria bacterium]|nr:zinc transporter ZntB [Alphaproteobacteria bacterium]